MTEQTPNFRELLAPIAERLEGIEIESLHDARFGERPVRFKLCEGRTSLHESAWVFSGHDELETFIFEGRKLLRELMPESQLLTLTLDWVKDGDVWKKHFVLS